MTSPAQPDPYRTQMDILVDWKREFIKLHGYYPNINDVWNKIDDLRGAEKSIRAGEISNICKLCRLRDECITEHDTRPRPAPAALETEHEQYERICKEVSQEQHDATIREQAKREEREKVLDEVNNRIWEHAFPPSGSLPGYFIVAWDDAKRVINSLRRGAP